MFSSVNVTPQNSRIGLVDEPSSNMREHAYTPESSIRSPNCRSREYKKQALPVGYTERRRSLGLEQYENDMITISDGRIDNISATR